MSFRPGITEECRMTGVTTIINLSESLESAKERDGYEKSYYGDILPPLRLRECKIKCVSYEKS